MKSGVELRPGENLVMELEAELWATSSNIIARLLGLLTRIYFFLCGIRIHEYLVITDQRVIEVRDRKACWVFDTEKEIKYVMPSSVKECGYAKVGTFCGCFCHAYTFYFEAWTQKTAILLKGVDEAGAQRIVNAFYQSISNPKI